MPATSLTGAGVLICRAINRLEEIRGACSDKNSDKAQNSAEWALASVLHVIQNETGVDFTEYGARLLVRKSLLSPDDPKGAAS